MICVRVALNVTVGVFFLAADRRGELEPTVSQTVKYLEFFSKPANKDLFQVNDIGVWSQILKPILADPF